MRLAIARRDVRRLARFSLAVEVVALVVAFVLGILHAAFTHGRVVDSFLLMTFVIFLLLVFYALLSGPGTFLARPRVTPIEARDAVGGRTWLTSPKFVRDREFFELVLYTGLGFLLLAIATGISLLVRALGG